MRRTLGLRARLGADRSIQSEAAFRAAATAIPPLSRGAKYVSAPHRRAYGVLMGPGVNLRDYARAFLASFATMAAACAAPSIGDDGWVGTAKAVTQPDGGDAAPPRCEDTSGEILTVLAQAPAGLAPHHLGRPLDADFNPIPGHEGRSLFPAETIRSTKVSTMEHKIRAIETARGFRASVKAWVVNASFSRSSSKRYASYHAYQVKEVREIDDATDMRQAPPGAVYYLWRLHYGHSFEMVVSGEDRTFTTSVRANFMVAGGGIGAFANAHNLETTAIGRGLEPIDGQAIFATSADQITAAYRTTGEAVPVFAEYRSIPRACIPPDEQIQWKDPKKVRVGFNKVNVYREGSSTWSLEGKCTINDREIPLANTEVMPRTGVDDDCKRELAGPKGDGSFCSYDLTWAANLEVVEGDAVRCGVSGLAGTRNIPYSQFRYDVKAENTPLTDKFGTGNGETEYWLFYALEFPK
jgi:hypothetical protein